MQAEAARGGACAGAACALKDRMAEEGMEGTVRVYGCPAEEIVVGKIRMNEQGVFDDLSAAVTWHPFDRNRVSYDIWQAQDIKNYKFYKYRRTCKCGAALCRDKLLYPLR